MRLFLAGLVLAAATPLAAQIVVASGERVVVAHDGVIELHDQSRMIWSRPGVAFASLAVAGDQSIAVADAWNNTVRVVSLADGNGSTLITGETPVDALFIGNDLYLLERDAATVSRYGADGSRASVRVAADPTILRQSRGSLYVYSRLDGVLQQLDPSLMRVIQQMPLPAFASGMEISGKTGYVLYPRDAELVAVNLETFTVQSTASAGGTPVDLAIASEGNALSAPRIAIADPAAKRLWITEGAQSVGSAFGRGFLRGLIGLGLFRPSSSDFPTGIDRVESRSSVTLAYDASGKTLYRSKSGDVRRIAEGIAPQAFTIAGGRIAFWRDGSLHWSD